MEQGLRQNIRYFRLPILWGTLISALMLCPNVNAQSKASGEEQRDFTNFSIEDLMRVDVTDAFKSPIPVIKVPAAIYVITQDDIRRNGATTVAEALRLVPGVEVSRIGSVYYTISIRGFGDYLASNKILVQLDGRTLYSPYQNTVYWEIEDMVMENIDRIEVILGPGGSLWGANAVNGVVNILTKHSKDTTGGLVTQSLGDIEKNRSVFQYGGHISADATYRIYGKYGVNHASDNVDGSSFGDGNSLNQIGFRADFALPGHEVLMVQGETAQYRITEDQPIALASPPYNVTYTNTDLVQTRHLLGKWSRDQRKGDQTTVQAYYDLIDYPYTNQGSRAEMYDVSVEQRLGARRRQEVAFGGGYRYMLNQDIPGPTAFLNPSRRRDTIVNLFGQDIVELTPLDRLTLGAKVEHNDNTGYEFQPNLRFSHIPNDSETYWASVGKADRTPSQSERNIFSLTSASPPSPGQTLPVTTANIGSANLVPETVIANEVGFRRRLNEKASVEGHAFYNIYDNLIYLAPGTPFVSTAFGSPILVNPSYFRNGESGKTYGLELSSKFEISGSLKSDTSFTTLNRSRFLKGSELAGPHYQATWHLAWSPSKRWELDSYLHWYDAIIEEGVPAYTKLDLHLTWKLSDAQEFSMGGYDLLVPRHYEFNGGSYTIRSLIASYKWRF